MQRRAWGRVLVVMATGLAILAPLGIVLYQSLLDAPFFQPSAKLSLDAFRFVFADGDFHRSLGSTLIVAFGMTALAVPLGGVLAFLVVRTDMPGRRWLEPALLIPIFLSPVVIAFGYVVALGPVGFVTMSWRDAFGSAPGWNIYSLASVTVIAGLTHIPHVYLYTSSTLRALGGDLEEAARISGAGTARIAFTISLPMVRPALLYSGVLV
ncbi:MAG: iron ABC transporter permease, partial [Chloroflexi bacterium]